jgi:hypothetical protein
MYPGELDAKRQNGGYNGYTGEDSGKLRAQSGNRHAIAVMFFLADCVIIAPIVAAVNAWFSGLCLRRHKGASA